MGEPGLSSRWWPIRSKPYDAEVLSSWLVRLSRAYGAEAARFWARVWPHRAVWRYDLDTGTDDAFVREVAAKTATPRRRVVATTVRGYRGYPKEALQGSTRPPWLLHVDRQALTRHWPWVQYCPQCLHADADPYFRREWRLAFMTACPTHHRRLLDRCGACGAVVNFHRLPGDAATMTRCYGCQGDLRFAHAPTIRRSVASHRLLGLQTFLLTTMRTGRCPVVSASTIQGAWFFRILHRRVQFTLTMRHAPAFREAFGADGDAAFFAAPRATRSQRAIERLSVEDRLALMRFLSWWFERWGAQCIRRAVETQLEA